MRETFVLWQILVLWWFFRERSVFVVTLTKTSVLCRFVMIGDEFFEHCVWLVFTETRKSCGACVVRENSWLNYQTARRHMPETITLMWPVLMWTLPYYKQILLLGQLLHCALTSWGLGTAFLHLHPPVRIYNSGNYWRVCIKRCIVCI